MTLKLSFLWGDTQEKFKTRQAISAGFFVSTVVTILVFLIPSPACESGLLKNTFGSRWNATCTGWSRELAIWHMTSDICMFYAYTTISLIVWKLHPVPRRIKSSQTTINLVCAFIYLCGSVHLVDAYCVLHPVYNMLASVKTISGLVGLLASASIGQSLLAVTKLLDDENEKIERRLADQGGR